MMVTFDICAGNPGALQFLMQAYDMDMFKAEQGSQRMQRAGITGARLYMLWNDCCNRDTEAALLATKAREASCGGQSETARPRNGWGASARPSEISAGCSPTAGPDNLRAALWERRAVLWVN